MNSIDIKTLAKKYWFVIVVGLLFISIAIYFAWDTNKDAIGAKSKDGKDIIYSLGDINYSADEYYEDLFDALTSDGSTNSGVMLAYTLLERSVVDQSVEVTDEMKESAKETLAQIDVSENETVIDSQLKQLGYGGIDDFEQFFLDIEKREAFLKNHIKENPELFDKIYKNESPRIISHILVKVDEGETDEETKAVLKEAKEKMAKIDKALETETFEEVAKQYSDDTTASSGGSLGIQFKDGSLVKEFETAAWKLKDGKVSKWVETEFGYHLIKVETSSKEDMLSDTYEDELYTVITEYYPSLMKETVWEKAKELEVEVKDEELKAGLLKYIGVKE